MEIIKKDSSSAVIRFDGGESLIDGLIEFCTEQNVSGAWVSGLGSSSSATVSYYDARTKNFFDHDLNEWLEITSMTGNIARLGESFTAHLHGTFGDKDLNTKAGHIKKLIVGATCEVLLVFLPWELERQYDESTGLNLLQ